MRMKIFLQKLLAVILVTTFIAPNITFIPTQTIFANYGMSGSGTVSDPYLISNTNELRLIEEDMTACYKLTADIDLNNQPWKPIGKMINTTQPEIFSGVLDGNGHTIKNLLINETVGGAVNSYAGFFYRLNDATVKNISFDSPTLSNTSASNPMTGTLAGFATNATVLNSNFNDINLSGGFDTGGAIGHIEGSLDIQNVNVIGDIRGGGFFVSGIVGYGKSTENGDSVIFKNSSFAGTLTNTGTGTAGIYG